MKTIQELGIAPLGQESSWAGPPFAYTDYWPEIFPRILHDVSGQNIGNGFRNAFSRYGQFMDDVRENIILGNRLATTDQYPTIFDEPPTVLGVLSEWDRGLGNFNPLEDAAPDFLRAAGVVMSRNLDPQNGTWQPTLESHPEDIFRRFNGLLELNPIEAQLPNRALCLAASFTYKAALLEAVPTRKHRLLKVAESMYDRVYTGQRLSNRSGLLQEAGEYRADIRFRLAMDGLRQAAAQKDTKTFNRSFVAMREVMKERTSAFRTLINTTQWHKPNGEYLISRSAQNAAGQAFQQFMLLGLRDTSLGLIYKGAAPTFEVRKALRHEDNTPMFSVVLPRRPTFDLVIWGTDPDAAVNSCPLQLKLGRDHDKASARRTDNSYLPGIPVLRAQGLPLADMNSVVAQLAQDYSKPGEIKPSRGVELVTARQIIARSIELAA